MGDVKKFPFEEKLIQRDKERYQKWAENYKRSPVKSDDDVFQLLSDLLVVVRLKIVESIFAQTNPPAEIRAAQGVILDVMDYLPERLAKAMVLDHIHPETAKKMPKVPRWEGARPGHDTDSGESPE